MGLVTAGVCWKIKARTAAPLLRAMHIFVPDTNFFLQCLDYKTLDWSLVTDDPNIAIAVPRIVQREIDRHKDGGNARRASRARKAWSLFAQVIDSDDNRLTTQVRNSFLSIELLMLKITAEDFPELDLQNPDDQIVAEALWVKQHRPGDSVTFISNDTAALATAKSQQLPFLRLPQQWMLPPEKDERDKTIDELRRKIEHLTSQHPELTFTLPDVLDNRISTHVTLFPALTNEEIEILMGEIRAQFPMAEHFPQETSTRRGDSLFELASRLRSPHEQWEPASEREINHYQKKAYPEWLRQTRSLLENMHQRLNADLFSSFTLTIENTGQQPAQKLLISCQAEGSIIFGAPSQNRDDEPDDEKPRLTAPPTPPAGKYVDAFERFRAASGFSDIFTRAREHSFPDVTGILASQRHDPNSLYWKPHPPKQETTQWALTCDEFRHQHEPHALKINFRPDPVTEGSLTGAIRCQAHASNLPERIELLIPIRVQVVRGDTANQVREALFRLR
ncbi:hypothetical protein CJO88_05650 [Ralstonia solanacearum]|nr:hypothetical protein CJO88_05650 [Ralstonia solanacearum]